ncbi:hypothetical protein A2999_02015 [Candidatus Wolfebacteria bacterium RIFCSPLOWO2_01_FULL_38_11]|uniref:Uncharacterized protein n=2 Tax=Candidatus Wolfeibacteriota TaxID=1752735 RepID=A0A0G0FSC5_9BACT|nr:MAG: hypothetical protein US36_C0011G0004 [Candidatus Wolfebacteria bacterium GW2011_GWC1_37_10]OGM90507.1 MAG: hypothetical protein A2999_02015 [Candidatus Wolfebacteria bacterium RIFCSPLOWO2_01_FULL_38_11]
MFENFEKSKPLEPNEKRLKENADKFKKENLQKSIEVLEKRRESAKNDAERTAIDAQISNKEKELKELGN